MQDEKNATIQIVDFTPEHYRRMQLRPEDAADIAGMPEDDLLAGWAEGRTVLYRGEVAAFYGAGVHRGTGYLWCVTSPLVEHIPLFVTRIGRALIRFLFRSGCHRVEAYCHKDNARSLRWLTRALGMRVEGLLRECGPNRQDRFMVAVLPSDLTGV